MPILRKAVASAGLLPCPADANLYSCKARFEMGKAGLGSGHVALYWVQILKQCVSEKADRLTLAVLACLQIVQCFVCTCIWALLAASRLEMYMQTFTCAGMVRGRGTRPTQFRCELGKVA